MTGGSGGSVELAVGGSGDGSATAAVAVDELVAVVVGVVVGPTAAEVEGKEELVARRTQLRSISTEMEPDAMHSSIAMARRTISE